MALTLACAGAVVTTAAPVFAQAPAVDPSIKTEDAVRFIKDAKKQNKLTEAQESHLTDEAKSDATGPGRALAKYKCVDLINKLAKEGIFSRYQKTRYLSYVEFANDREAVEFQKTLEEMVSGLPNK